jgi:hypothetical protein
MGEANLNRNIGQSSRGGRHPASNLDGTRDALRLTKRLVQTSGDGVVDTEVRNVNSEVEHEVQNERVRREDDENDNRDDNDRGEESDDDSDPDADEVPSDYTFSP